MKKENKNIIDLRNVALNIQEMTIIAEDFLAKKYDIKLSESNLEIKLNGRLGRRTLGWYKHSANMKKIELCSDIKAFDFDSKYNNLQSNISTLLHELIHFSLHSLGKKYRDGQADFELELKKYHINSNYDKDAIFKKCEHIMGAEEFKTFSNLFEEYENAKPNLIEEYEKMILKLRKEQNAEVYERIAANVVSSTVTRKNIKVIIDGKELTTKTKSQMAKLIREEYGYPADGWWFVQGELPKKYHSIVDYIAVDDVVLYQKDAE